MWNIPLYQYITKMFQVSILLCKQKTFILIYSDVSRHRDMEREF